MIDSVMVVDTQSLPAWENCTDITVLRSKFCNDFAPSEKLEPQTIGWRSGLGTFTNIDVLIIADDKDQQTLLARVLQRVQVSSITADTHQQGIYQLNTLSTKVVICDYDLPGGGGVELCKTIRMDSNLSDTYIIVMSAGGNEALTEALEAGADDYLSKPFNLQEVVSRVHVGLRVWKMHQQLRQAALTDGLTGLYNHDQFNSTMEAELDRARRYGHPMTLMMLDVDFFKAINDTYGHLAGNEALKQLGIILREKVRTMDTVARFGGDEFAVLLPEATCRDAVIIAQRIKTTLTETVKIDQHKHHVMTISIGIADSMNVDSITGVTLVDLADRALYLAKRRGRDQIATAEDLDESHEINAMIEHDDVEWMRRRIAVLSTQAKEVYMQSIAALLQTLDEKDPYTARHSLNVAFYAQELAEYMQFNQTMVKAIYNAALLHDIGKIGVPDRILMKRSQLTLLEKTVFEQVPLIGTRIVDHLRILESEIQIIRHQREYFDGSGFPSGLQGRQIPIGSRILLVADAFDAMTTERVYRKARSIDEAIVELNDCAKKQFDADIINALCKLMKERRPIWQQRIDEAIKAVGSTPAMRLSAMTT